MTRQLTDKQQKLLNVLFEEAGGDLVQAKKLAGYADTSNTTEIVKGLKEEILEATQMYMARNAPKAAMDEALLIGNDANRLPPRLFSVHNCPTAKTPGPSAGLLNVAPTHQ